MYSPGPFMPKWPKKFLIKKDCFDFAVVLCSIGAPDLPKNFAKRSEMENSVF